uniref:BHLH domain-containing protein n=1 Tax=Electrophorus electricus TaxID=8005 RepID=A0A4W4FRU9_ELEEL
MSSHLCYPQLLKPQVERRRRERMNRSLENLRLLLLQGSEQQMLSHRRVEKAEILEQTVLFLQSSTKKARVGVEGKEGYPFLEGFSACLEKATHFMQQEGKTRGLNVSLSTTLRSRLSGPWAVPQWGRVPPCATVPEAARHEQKRSPVCMRRGPCTAGRCGHSHSCKVLLRHMDHNALGCHANTATTSRAPCGLQAPVRPCVWRPWP